MFRSSVIPRLLALALTLALAGATAGDDRWRSLGPEGGEGKAILMVEQNAKKGLEFGYVLVSGSVAMTEPGDDLLRHPDVGRLFLGG